jgi:hypothetical protein
MAGVGPTGPCHVEVRRDVRPESRGTLAGLPG